MPYNGGGNYTPPSADFPAVAGTLIQASKFNNILNDVSTALSTVVTKDGQTTITANLPMAGFKLTGLGAGTAAGQTLRYEQGVQSIMTTLGDYLYASAANVAARLPATATVAAHATTADLWGAREIVLSGAVVTFTNIANAPYVGATVWVRMNAAHIWTQNAVFTVQGGATYTTAAGDWVRIRATTVSTFDVSIFSALAPPKGSGLVLLSSGTAAASATLDFTGLTGYNSYLVVMTKIAPSVDAATLRWRGSTDGGGTWDSGANYLGQYLLATNTTIDASTDSSTSSIAGVAVDSGVEGITGEYSLTTGSTNTLVGAVWCRNSAASASQLQVAGGIYNGATTTAIRFFFNSGNIASGNIRIYGRR